MTYTTPKMQKIRQILANFSIISAVLATLISPVAAAAQVTTPSTTDTLATTQNDVNEMFNLDIPADAPDRVARVILSAYTSSPDETDDTPCISADGSNICNLNEGVVAVNGGLPFGTKIRIPSLFGTKVFVVHDRMNKRYACKLGGECYMDIYFKTGGKSEAYKFGRRTAEVEITFPEIAKK